MEENDEEKRVADKTYDEKWFAIIILVSTVVLLNLWTASKWNNRIYIFHFILFLRSDFNYLAVFNRRRVNKIEIDYDP